MIYCKQIPPEYQESRLFDDERTGTDYINVTGNRHYISRTSPLFDRVLDTLDNGELSEVLDDMQNGGYYSGSYRNATEAINDLLAPEKARYSTRDIHALKELVKAYAESGKENDILCKVLSVVTGREWEWQIIRGCCQGDWNEIFYPVEEWSREALDAFETMYFNTGEEWVIHDEENIPEGPEEVNGYSCYTVSGTEEGTRKELAEIAGCSPDDLVLWAFDGFIQVPQYKAV